MLFIRRHNDLMAFLNPWPLRVLRRMAVAWTLALAWSCALAHGGWDRNASPVFRHAGLPNDVTPMAMLQDSGGLMWIGAQNGLVSWDGYRWRRYMAEPSAATGPTSSFINALLEDVQGRLWLATDGGLARLDRSKGYFAAAGVKPQELSNVRVFALAADGADTLWIGTAAGLDRLEFSTGRVVRHSEGAALPGLPARRIYAILIDSRRNFWVGTDGGLYVLRKGASAFQPVATDSNTQPAIEVRRVVEISDGRVWVGTRASGAFVVEPGATSARQVRDHGEHGAGKDLETDWVAAILEVGDHQVWLGTWANGLVQVDTRTGATRRLRHDPEVPFSLGHEGVLAMMRDRGGLAWIAGPGSLDSHDPAQHAVSTWNGGGGRLVGGTGANLTSVFTQPDGSVWLGSLGGGVDVISPDGGHVMRLEPREEPARNALPKVAVLAVLDAPDGSNYVGTAKGLYRVHRGTHRVEKVVWPGMEPTVGVAALCMTGTRLWLGSLDGLRHVDLSAPRPTVAAVAGLKNSHIVSLACRDDGSLWVGTRTGLVRYRLAGDVLERPWPEEKGQVGVPGNPVTAVVQDKRGRLWISTFGAGVRVVETDAAGEATRIHRIDHEEGLTNGAANALLLDAQGHAWVSTDDGIARIDGDTFATTLLQQVDGVGLLTYWGTAAAATQQGDLLFGGKGLTIVHPGEFRPERIEAPIVLTQMDGRPVPPSGITLAPSERAVQLTFALLDFQAPERTRYAYRLAGLEEEWTDSSADLRLARYTNVPPGDYVLEVKAAGRTGEWTTARWPLQVRPAWHETAAFRLLMVALALALVLLLIRLRTRLLERRATTLHGLVAQRTLELEQRTQELESRTRDLQESTRELECSRSALRELSAHNAHAIEEERKHVARELHDELGQQMAALRMEVSVLRIHAGSGRAPAAEEWAGIGARVDGLVASVRSIVTMLRPPALDAGLAPAIEWLGSQLTRHTGASCEVDVDPATGSLAPDVATTMFRIVQEALNNVRRHAEARHVSVQLRKDADDWRLTIADDGVGFVPRPGCRSGYGILGMRERARLLDGVFRVISEPGRGTRIELSVRSAGQGIES